MVVVDHGSKVASSPYPRCSFTSYFSRLLVLPDITQAYPGIFCPFALLALDGFARAGSNDTVRQSNERVDLKSILITLDLCYSQKMTMILVLRGRRSYVSIVSATNISFLQVSRGQFYSYSKVDTANFTSGGYEAFENVRRWSDKISQ